MSGLNIKEIERLTGEQLRKLPMGKPIKPKKPKPTNWKELGIPSFD